MVANVRREASNLRWILICFRVPDRELAAEFSPVEVMHTTNILGITQASNSQLNAMVGALTAFRRSLLIRRKEKLESVCVCVTRLVLLCSGKATEFSGASYSSGPHTIPVF